MDCEAALKEMMDRSYSNRAYKHAMCMSLLQEKAGLSYEEARAVLYVNWETIFGLAAEFGISNEDVFNLRRRGIDKIDAIGVTVDELCGEYRLPLCMVDP